MPLIRKGLTPSTPQPTPEPLPDDPHRIQILAQTIILESHDAFFALASLRPVLRRQEKLLPKLQDDTLHNDPAYARAAMTSIALDTHMATLLNIVASSESDAQRAWAQLPPPDRAEAAHWWHADPAQPSLIGHSFNAWPQCEIPPDFPLTHLPRILRTLRGWPTFDAWRKTGVYHP